MDEKIKAIKKYWNEYAERFDEEHATERLDLWREILRSLMGEIKTGKVLDVGAGTGFLALMMAELGYETWGIDLAEDMLAQGRKNAVGRGVKVEFIYGLAENLPFPDNSFDAIVNARVLWTLMDPQQTLVEWKRVLRPGGKLLSFMPIPKLMPNTFKTYGDEYDIRLPLKNAQEDVLVHEMEKAGYVNCQAIFLPEHIKLIEGKNPWAVIYCEK